MTPIEARTGPARRHGASSAADGIEVRRRPSPASIGRFPSPADRIRTGATSVGRRFPAVILGVAAVILLSVGFGPNLNLALLSLAVLVVGCIVLWRPGETPFLCVTFCVHWLGASVAIFYANWLDLDILRASVFGGEISLATVLSLVGILFLAFGMRVGAGTWRPREAESALSIACAHPVSRWFGLYCIALAVSLTALAFMWVLPGLSQALLALAGLRWAFFFVLAYASFARGGVGGMYFPLAFAIELALGLGTYFSDFRTVFFFSIYAALASGLRLNARMQALLALLIVALVSFSIVWTGVKQEYRAFISGGQREQVVSVDYATRLGKLADLTGALDARAVEAGFDQILRRLSYVEYFSVVLVHVPAAIAHENGALLVDALTRPFLPRAFFPDKAVIDDTERTNLYTGGIAGVSEATSISIGYVGEAYIDFGTYGMMLALFGVGCGYGYGYRLLSRSKVAGSLVGMGLATAALQPIGFLETSFTKAAGGLAITLLVTWLFVKFLIPLCLRWVAMPDGGR